MGGIIVIEAKQISLRYQDDTLALQDVNLSIKQGDLVYITGPSGSGKTSLLKLIMGVEYPTAGMLTVMGQPVRKGEAAGIRMLRRRIGPVFQEFKLIKGRTVMENVMTGMRFLGMRKKDIREAAANALERVGLAHKKDSLVEHLSWGEAQRVAIARAVARKPSLILADEPTGNLDHDNAVNILDILKSFRDGDTAVVITTHATHLIEHEEDAVYIRIENGRLTAERRADR
jgi:cell division transport system ATP-binding protein